MPTEGLDSDPIGLLCPFLDTSGRKSSGWPLGIVCWALPLGLNGFHRLIGTMEIWRPGVSFGIGYETSPGSCSSTCQY